MAGAARRGGFKEETEDGQNTTHVSHSFLGHVEPLRRRYCGASLHNVPMSSAQGGIVRVLWRVAGRSGEDQAHNLPPTSARVRVPALRRREASGDGPWPAIGTWAISGRTEASASSHLVAWRRGDGWPGVFSPLLSYRRHILCRPWRAMEGQGPSSVSAWDDIGIELLPAYAQSSVSVVLFVVAVSASLVLGGSSPGGAHRRRQRKGR